MKEIERSGEGYLRKILRMGRIPRAAMTYVIFAFSVSMQNFEQPPLRDHLAAIR